MVFLTALVMSVPLVSLGQEIPELREYLKGNVSVFPPLPPTKIECRFSIYYTFFPKPLVNLVKSKVSCNTKRSTRIKDYTISSELGNYFFTLDFYLKKGRGKITKATIQPDTTGPENSDNAKFFNDAALSYPGCLICLIENAPMCIEACFPENPPKCFACIVEVARECLTPCGFSRIHQQLGGFVVAENGTEIESNPPQPGTCTAHLVWFHCDFTHQYCNTAEGYTGRNFYDYGYARCCCKCCTSTNSCGTTTC